MLVTVLERVSCFSLILQLGISAMSSQVLVPFSFPFPLVDIKILKRARATENLPETLISPNESVTLSLKLKNRLEYCCYNASSSVRYLRFKCGAPPFNSTQRVDSVSGMDRVLDVDLRDKRRRCGVWLQMRVPLYWTPPICDVHGRPNPKYH